jgi:hypothetical protein
MARPQCKREGHQGVDQLLKSAGCNIHGRVDVNKVAGNLHVAPGKSFQANHMHIHDINSFIARGEAYVSERARERERDRETGGVGDRSGHTRTGVCVCVCVCVCVALLCMCGTAVCWGGG